MKNIKIGKISFLNRIVAVLLAICSVTIGFPPIEAKAADKSVYVNLSDGGSASIGTIHIGEEIAVNTNCPNCNNPYNVAIRNLSPSSSVTADIPAGAPGFFTLTGTGSSALEICTFDYECTTPGGCGASGHFQVTYNVDLNDNECTINVNSAVFGVRDSQLNVETTKKYSSSMEFVRYWDASNTTYSNLIESATDGTTPNPYYYSEMKEFNSGAYLEPGNYVAYYWINPYQAHYTYSKSNFTINKATPDFTIADVKEKETIEPHIIAPTSDGPGVDITTVEGMFGTTIKYKKASEGDSAYTTEIPMTAGEYVAKLFYESGSLAESWYKQVSTTFQIIQTLKDGEGEVKVKDTVYGESKVKPEAISKTNGIDNVTFYYKLKTEDDEKFTKEIPEKPGKYVCKAIFAAKGEYREVEARCEFTIDKGVGKGAVTATNCYVGTTPSIVPSSVTNGLENVKYYYKLSSAADSAYTETLPTKPGTYSVKAVFGMTDYFYETFATGTFKVDYMPAPEFGLTGSKGKNDFFLGDVTIKAPAGYLVSLSENGNYTDSIKLLPGAKAVYFKDAKTGALSDKVSLPEYKIDAISPDFGGVKNGDVIYKDSFDLAITDENLDTVTVNGKSLPVKGGRCTYTLESDGGECEYVVIATDLAGHSVSYTITVAASWTEDGIIPMGKLVKLKPGKEYKLSSGSWTVEGDDTVYSGGSSFYVSGDKELSFSKSE